MMQSTCNVSECVKPIHAKGWCYAHYMRAWRYGSPTFVHPARFKDVAGQRFGCLIARDRVDQRGMKMWRCDCDCGGSLTTRIGDLNNGNVVSCGDRRTHRGNDVSYDAAHQRVRSDRGPAAQFPCVDCASSAQHWSYSHRDPDELVAQSGQWAGLPYSLDTAQYEPRCVPCHKRFDLDHLAISGLGTA